MDEATAAAEAEAQPGQPTAEATAEVEPLPTPAAMRAMRQLSRAYRSSRETPWSSEKDKDHDEHRAAERAADAAPVLEEVPHLQPQRADAQAVRGAHGRQSVQRMAPEPAAETAGRGVRRRHGQDGGDGQPQNPPAPVGRRGAAASAPSRAAAGRAPVDKTWKNIEPSASECVLASRRCWNTSKKASLLSASLCPTATPASTDPATSTWTNSRNPRSRWPKIQGRTLSWERPQTFPSTAAPQFSAAWVRHRHGGRSLPERWLRSAAASRSRSAQQQFQRAPWRGRRSWAHEHHCCRRQWSAKLRRTLASGMPQGRRTQWSNGCCRRSSAAQQIRNASSSRLGKERRRSRRQPPKT